MMMVQLTIFRLYDSVEAFSKNRTVNLEFDIFLG